MLSTLRKSFNIKGKLSGVSGVEPKATIIQLMTYNWQQSDWPNFIYSNNKIEAELYKYSSSLGKIEAPLTQLSAKRKQDIILHLMINEAMKTSEIEGEYMSREDILSSIKGSLGLSSKHISKTRGP